MADTTGVQVFVGPANQLEIGTVTEGPTAVTLETVSDRLQRVNFVISAPTAEVLAEASASADSAAASATSSGNSAASAAAAVTEANGAKAAAQAALAAAEAAAPTQEQVTTAVDSLMPTRIAIDEDGRPYFF